MDDHHAPWQIAIANTVADMAPGDVPHLFERFWRRDPARAASVHNGLGLAVTRALATSLGMGITAHLERPTVLRLILTGGRPFLRR